MKAMALLLAVAAAVSTVVAGRLAVSDGLAARWPQAVISVPAPTVPRDLLARLGASALGRRLAGSAASDALVGAGWTLDPARFGGIRVVAAAAGLGLGAVAPFPGPLLAPLLGFVGARLPLFLAARAARRRRAEVDAEIPQLLDLLAAGSSAGLAAPLALRRAVEGLQGPLATELALALDAVDLGGRWRDELRALAERLQLADLTRTVAAITRTEALGSSLADSTVELAATVRASRRAAVTERARTAPVKMLFPLVFLVLPAFLLLTVVPVLLTTLQSIR